MASQDDIYSILDRLKKNKLEYLLIVLDNGKNKTNASVFHNINKKTSKEKANFVLMNILNEFQKGI